jgi:L-alanine-DL-glutamate epimerase-like enolase superfamily enzyme
MKCSRRHFLQTTAVVGVSAAATPLFAREAKDFSRFPRVTDEMLMQAAAQPVLQLKGLKDPVIIESIELLRKGKDHFVRVRSKDGAEGVSVDDGRMHLFHPILNEQVIPPFLGKDARNLEELLFEAYRYQSNYKMQGLPFWCPMAMVEFAILDLLGRVTQQSLGEMLGGIVRTTVPFYVASGRRDTTSPQEIEYLQGLVAKTGAKALKFRVGGRMSRNADAMPGRTETLIPLVRKTFGDQMVMHADSNSSYDPPKAIEVGRLLEDYGAIHYEEPCPFDNFDDTRKVTEALKIPVAFGEQESSHWRFQWCIREHVVDIVQPDLYYYGGLIRSRRVARMADLANMATTCHLSGGFGFVYSLHFASCTPKVGPWQEYKKGVESYGQWFNPPLKIVDGAISVPKGPGLGLADPKEILKDAKVVTDEAPKGASDSAG